MNARRIFLRNVLCAGLATTLGPRRYDCATIKSDFPVVRPLPSGRKFVSNAVEAKITEVEGTMADRELAWLFENCFPNTLDTTVTFGIRDNRPDTLVVTGDINAMWLRDSSAQVIPYLGL